MDMLTKTYPEFTFILSFAKILKINKIGKNKEHFWLGADSNNLFLYFPNFVYRIYFSYTSFLILTVNKYQT